jgi:Ser/Thr protein kinase RdoA (MazF antagonist)
VISVLPYGNGLVNKTFLVTTTNQKYIIQEINKTVFKNPHLVMHNIDLITNHLRNKGNERSLKIIKTKTGRNYLFLKGKYYRCYNYIEGTVCFDKATDINQFYQVGKAVGKFQKDLIDFDVDKLADTIPNFHNTPHRFEQFLEALKEDPMKRAELVRPETRFVLKHYQTTKILEDQIKQNKIPKRVSHNDTKLNNVRFDIETKEAVCLVDLDTVMAGSVLYDFGDAIRIGAASSYEDEPDLSKMTIDLNYFQAFSVGFLETTIDFLTPDEIDNLVNSVKVITLECGIRFLTDFLNGDSYFRIEYPLHNLIRARAQFKLFQEIEKKEKLMKEIINNVASKVMNAQEVNLELLFFIVNFK